MKIGILTFHRANNFGAVLQCYALQKFLQKQGVDVHVIDYRQQYIESIYNTLNLYALLSKLLHPMGFFKYLQGIFKRKERNKKFKEFSAAYLNTSNRIKGNKIWGYDIILHGSDQIWNPKLTGGDYDDIYLGNYKASSNCKKIGYALSFEQKEIDKSKINYVRKSIDNFTFLSVRETALKNILVPVTRKEIDVVVDPTLLLEGQDYVPLIKKPSVNVPYVLVYAVGPSELALDTAKVVAKERDLKIIDVSHADITPNEFLGYIKAASFVIAVSFHGTVFSILFRKNFYTILSGQPSDVRYKELLVNTNLQDRLIDTIPQSISDVNFSSFEQDREKYVSSSKQFLLKLLVE